MRTILNTLALYVMAALLIGYFGFNAYNGAHGLKAKHDIDRQIAALTGELTQLRLQRTDWQHRVDLLKPDDIDADMLDERARALLDYVDPDDLTMVIKGAPPAETLGP